MKDKDIEKLAIERGEKQKRAKRRRRPPTPIILVAAGVIVVLLVLWGFFTRGVAVKVATVSEVYPSQLITRISASGYVVAQRKADVATKITGQLVSLMVQEGSVVKEGQVMAKLEDSDVRTAVEENRSNLRLAQARVREAEAALHDASLTYERMRNLVKSGAVSRSEFDAAQSRYLASKASLDAAQAAVKSSQAALKGAEVSLSYTEVRAPFDAVVLTKNADVGDIITPLGSAANAKAAVVTIADLSSLQVEADVSESNLNKVSVGAPCDITLDALPGEHFRGVVDTIVPTVDRTKATVLVKVRFIEKDPRILPEMSARVGFLSRPLEPGEQKPRVMVNKSAVVSSEEERHAFLVQGEKAVQTSVKTGEELGGMVTVLQGIKPGDTVIVDPPKGLRDGSKVTILEE